MGDRKRSEVAEYSARPLDFLSAPHTNRLYGGTAQWGANERYLFPGAVALVLSVVGLWRASDPRLRIHAAGLAFSLVLTLGFNAGLYTLLYDWVPPFRGLRVPARAGILVLLGVAVLAGAGFARVLGRARSRTVEASRAIAVIGACAAEYRTSPPLVDGRSAAGGLVCDVARHARCRGLRVAGHRAVAPRHHARRALHVSLDGALAAVAERLQRQLPQVVSRAVERNAIVSPYVGAQISAPPRRDGAGGARTPGQPTALRRGALRLLSDPNVALIVESRYAGSRVAFFRLRSAARQSVRIGPTPTTAVIDGASPARDARPRRARSRFRCTTSTATRRRRNQASRAPCRSRDSRRSSIASPSWRSRAVGQAPGRGSCRCSRSRGRHGRFRRRSGLARRPRACVRKTATLSRYSVPERPVTPTCRMSFTAK